MDDCKRKFTHANRHCPEHPHAQLRRYIAPPDKEKGANSHNRENENCSTPTKSARKPGGIFAEKNSSDEDGVDVSKWLSNKYVDVVVIVVSAVLIGFSFVFQIEGWFGKD